MTPLAHPPDLGRDIAWAAFGVAFPKRKADDWAIHRERVAQFRFFCSNAAFFPKAIHDGFGMGLRQWSESLAALVARN